MKRICIIAQFPPPIHGLSKAVETLFESNLKNKYYFEKVDITRNSMFLPNYFKIRNSKADLFYFTISQSQGGNIRDLIILSLLRKQKKRYLIHLHGGYYRTLLDNRLPEIQRRMNIKLLKEAAGTIVLGPSLRYIFDSIVPQEKIFTVPNCVDDKYLISDEAFIRKIENAKEKSIKNVLYMSNFIPSKGYGYVLEMALAEKKYRLETGKQRFHYCFAGKFYSRTERIKFDRFIADNALEECATYFGVVSGECKRKLLEGCDYFVLLSSYPKEGQPISIIEAMGNGMAVLTTNHAGIPDLVKDGVNGRVFSVSEVPSGEELNNCLLHLPLKDIQVENRKAIISHFMQDDYIGNMEKVFRKAISDVG